MALVHDYADIARRMNFGKSKGKSTESSVLVVEEIIIDPTHKHLKPNLPQTMCPHCGSGDTYITPTVYRCRHCLKAF